MREKTRKEKKTSHSVLRRAQKEPEVSQKTSSVQQNGGNFSPHPAVICLRTLPSLLSAARPAGRRQGEKSSTGGWTEVWVFIFFIYFYFFYGGGAVHRSLSVFLPSPNQEGPRATKGRGFLDPCEDMKLCFYFLITHTHTNTHAKH